MARTAAVALRWRDHLVFEGESAGKPAITVDGDTKVATSPVELLLLAAGTCAASDVVLILQKQRVELRALDVAVEATRREEQPRRVTALHLRFTISGGGVDETKARRAIDLSLQKYCSVVASLAADIPVTYDVAIA